MGQTSWHAQFIQHCLNGLCQKIHIFFGLYALTRMVALMYIHGLRANYPRGVTMHIYYTIINNK